MSENSHRRGFPKHADPSSDNRCSFAPYNFVPLPEAVLAAPHLPDGSGPWEHHDEYLPGTHSGWIDLEITTETPLYIRCAPPVEHSSPDEPRANRHRQDFFHHGAPGVPVLPGSSLRGMVRSMVEILSHSSLPKGWFSDRKLFYRAVGDSTSLGIEYRGQTLGPNKASPPDMQFDYPNTDMKAGYLRRRGGDWFIQPAQQYNGESFVHVEYSDARSVIHGEGRQRVHPVFVEPVRRAVSKRGQRGSGQLTLELALARRLLACGPRTPTPPSPLVEGWLVESGHMGRPWGQSPRPHQKHMHCVVFGPDESAQGIPISRELRRLYEDDREIARGPKTQTRRLFPGTDVEPTPVFFLIYNGELAGFGPTMMFRLPYPASLSAFIPGDVRDSETVDLAQAVFGRVGTSGCIRGRVRFEDAPWNRQGDTPYLNDGDAGLRTPSILGSPKPTAFQHYLVQPKLDAFHGNSTVRSSAGDDPRTLCHYHHPLRDEGHDLLDNREVPVGQTEGTIIRGYKRYWHKHPPSNEGPFEPELANNSDTQRTIIRPVQDQTTFVGRVRFENLTDVELGALWTALQLAPHQRHHLGMGKSLGMGSVRVAPRLHVIDRDARYATLFDTAGQRASGEKSEADTSVICDCCALAFSKLVVDHHNAHSSPEVRVRDLWQIPRLADLAALLEWDNAPPCDKIGFAPPGNPPPPNNLKWWRERRVLPTPRQVLDERASHPAPSPPAAPHAVPNSKTANPPNSAPPVQPLPVSRKVPIQPKRRCHSPATVKFLGPRASGKKGFRVQELGKPEGTLTLGVPPAKLPTEGDDIPVLVHVDDAKSPQYKWPS